VLTIAIDIAQESQYRVQELDFSFCFPKQYIDVLISDFNKINSFAYNSAHSSSFECFPSYNENKGITLKDLIKVVEDHEN